MGKCIENSVGLEWQKQWEQMFSIYQESKY